MARVGVNLAFPRLRSVSDNVTLKFVGENVPYEKGDGDIVRA